MPWQKNYDESAVLERAMRAFWARGYEATSMAELVKTTGINRGSMYAAYPSKHNLFVAALKHYDRLYRVEHLKSIATAHPPREAILAVFNIAAKYPDDPSLPPGCLLVNTALEMSPHDPEIKQLVDRSLRGVENFFRARLKAAQREGTIGTGLDVNASSSALLGLFVGLRVLTRAGSAQSTLDAVLQQAEAMLD